MVDHSWIESMQDELNQFERLQVWELVPRPEGKNVIALKWLWKNKYDAENIMVRNKSRLVASDDLMKYPSKEDLDNLFSPMFEDYFEQKSSDTTINSAAQLTPIQKLLHFYSSIYFDELTSRKILADFDGCKQEEGIDFEESFALLLVLRLSGVHDFGCSYEYHYLSNECHKTAFLNGPFCEKKGRSMRTMRFKDDYKSTSGGLQFLGGKARELSLRVPLYSFNPVNILRQSHWTSGIILLRNSLSGVLWKFSLSEHYTNLADLFTNALPKERFEYLVHRIVIIMVQQQQAADVHPDELCPPNKRYDLMDANKKVDLENVQCPSESKILMNIIKNHPLRFNIAASTSVPWIYMALFWHTLKEDGSKHQLKFLLDRKELTLTLDDFRTIFHLPQANDNNHASFVPPLSFTDMVPFYKQVLGFTMELKTVSNFKISGLLQPW
ncbi:hypothetical protein Tco_0477528 [Tanacetum coccineum]